MHLRLTARSLWLTACFLLCTTIALAQQKTITGRVTDANGQPVAGATVAVRGTNIGTSTNEQGRFTIAVPNNNATLVVSYVGQETQELSVGTQTDLTVSMRPAAANLNEVVVTGYTAQRKKDIIGAVSVINTEQLTSNPSANLAAQLQGRAAGVVVSSTGQPGSPAVVRVRGFQSFGNNNPLYIIDGVPTEDPSLLNPQDIETIQVLKDATSASIYGTRAANGVIIVTTRQGRAGRTQLIYEGFGGVQVVTDKMKPDLLNTPQYIEYLQRTTGPTYKHPVFGQNGSFTVPDYFVVSNTFKGAVPAGDPRINPSLYSLTPGSIYQIYKMDPMGTNWHDVITRKGLIQSHQVTATGGTEKATYSIGLNYYQQEGVFRYTDYKRYTVRANSSFKPKNWLRIGENLQLSYEDRLGGSQRGEGGAWAWAYRMVPYLPVYDIMGGWGGNAVGESGNASSPLATLYRDKDDKNQFNKLFGNVFAEIPVGNFLTARTSMGIDYGNQFVVDISRRTYERAENQGTTMLTEDGWNYLNWTWTNTLNFQKTFAANHDVKLLLGSEAIKRRSRGVRAFGQNFDFEDPDFINLNTAVASSLGDRRIETINQGRSAIFSLFSRVDYAYRGKYLLNATFRRDGASVFGTETRYGNFPSVGIG
ncbi:MAG: SusC/RagA family TonB-linked outer membrane protein, partial [Flavisolibacter sp.]|nr:SusC/RagA family TonB-linked outer membrane protein [Flavisolibacter sp.]